MDFFTTSNTGAYGAYRRSKMVIDALNILLAVVIVVLFVALIFLNDRRSFLFPLIFLAGGIDNALAAAKNFHELQPYRRDCAYGCGCASLAACIHML